MSETEHYKGKLIKIDGLDGLSFSEAIEVLKEKYEIEESDYYEEDNYLESENLIYINNVFYEMQRKQYDAYDDIIEAKKIDNGYEFELRYYNGGCGFSEALEEAIDNAE